MFDEMFTDGIFSTDDFYVQANNSMQLTISKGNAHIKGAFFPSESDTTLLIDSADGTNTRYDAVAIEFNTADIKTS